MFANPSTFDLSAEYMAVAGAVHSHPQDYEGCPSGGI